LNRYWSTVVLAAQDSMNVSDTKSVCAKVVADSGPVWELFAHGGMPTLEQWQTDAMPWFTRLHAVRDEIEDARSLSPETREELVDNAGEVENLQTRVEKLISDLPINAGNADVLLHHLNEWPGQAARDNKPAGEDAMLAFRFAIELQVLWAPAAKEPLAPLLALICFSLEAPLPSMLPEGVEAIEWPFFEMDQMWAASEKLLQAEGSGDQETDFWVPPHMLRRISNFQHQFMSICVIIVVGPVCISFGHARHARGRYVAATPNIFFYLRVSINGEFGPRKSYLIN
jgi:hypothetical protein